MVGTTECGIDFNKFPIKLDLKQTLHSPITVNRDVIPYKSSQNRRGVCDNNRVLFLFFPLLFLSSFFSFSPGSCRNECSPAEGLSSLLQPLQFYPLRQQRSLPYNKCMTYTVHTVRMASARPRPLPGLPDPAHWHLSLFIVLDFFFSLFPRARSSRALL